MRHPTQATLALHAGGDLGLLARWNTERHLGKCERCSDEVAAFARVLEIMPELGEIPEVPWNRLGAEMRANIRLGLAAGECVRSEPSLREPALPLLTWARTAVAFASLVLLVLTGLMLEHPAPAPSVPILRRQRGQRHPQISRR